MILIFPTFMIFFLVTIVLTSSSFIPGALTLEQLGTEMNQKLKELKQFVQFSNTLANATTYSQI